MILLSSGREVRWSAINWFSIVILINMKQLQNIDWEVNEANILNNACINCGVADRRSSFGNDNFFCKKRKIEIKKWKTSYHWCKEHNTKKKRKISGIVWEICEVSRLFMAYNFFFFPFFTWKNFVLKIVRTGIRKSLRDRLSFISTEPTVRTATWPLSY